MNINKQIEYWKSGACNDIETAELLIKNNKLLHGLFFCHLVIEKIIKAQVVKFTKQVPPKSHNLNWLLEKTDLQLSNKDKDFIGILMNFQLEGRYPQYFPPPPSNKVANEHLLKTKELLSCLKNKL